MKAWFFVLALDAAVNVIFGVTVRTSLGTPYLKRTRCRDRPLGAAGAALHYRVVEAAYAAEAVTAGGCHDQDAGRVAATLQVRIAC